MNFLMEMYIKFRITEITASVSSTVVAIDNNNSLLLLLFGLMIKISDIATKTVRKLRIKMAKKKKYKS